MTIQCIVHKTWINSFYPANLHAWFYSTPFPKTCMSETISQTLIQTNQYVFFKKFACNIKENGLAGTSFICNTSFTITWYIVCGGKTCLSWLDRCTAMRIPRSGLDLEISTYPPLKTRRKVPGKRFSTSCF